MSYTADDVRKYLKDNHVDPDGVQFVAFQEEIRPNIFYKDATPGIPNAPDPLVVLGVASPPRQGRVCYNNITLPQLLIWTGVSALVFWYIFDTLLRSLLGV